ncbi:hypothetical protein T10_12963 [Trichinella papuae]|uniref:Uncharacterized protein n=1 Tax=Trichinella papuae TaxID=268474 RepID=A0A0V1MNK0_9BILA|nr:hypothetical protein T10_12963 [Trichinella papuae]
MEPAAGFLESSYLISISITSCLLPVTPVSQGNTHVNLRYRKESAFIAAISRFQSQLTDFPMYRLLEVEVAVLYPRIRKVAPNLRSQGCTKSQMIVSGLRSTSRAAALVIKAWNKNPHVSMSLLVHKP